jgi:hypothetical protein
MARKSKKQRATEEAQVLNEMRERLNKRLSESPYDPFPDEPQPQMRDAMRQAVTYSAPVPIR